MRIDLVTIEVKPEFRDRFIAETLLNAKGSKENEPGVVRWDVFADIDNPNKFFLNEVYKDVDAENDHMTTAHYHRWKKATQNWFAKPYEVSVCNSVFPQDADWE